MIKVVNWNIRHGLGNDGKTDIKRVAELLAELNADFYTIQEIDRFMPRSERVDQLSYIANTLGYHSHFVQTVWVRTGEYGIATFSKEPILKKNEIRLGKKKSNNHTIAITETVNHKIVNLHAPPPWDEQEIWWNKFMKNNFADAILSGDFNNTPDSKVMQSIFSKNLYNSLNESETFNEEGLIFDYTLVPKNLTIQLQEVIPSDFSDHNILVTSIQN
jgi:endonuclease/exonuclease/phosphatase family metal-dependent hydrolase